MEGARAGVDVGGTFTDVVLAAGDRLVVAKLLSTPGDYGQAIVEGTLATAREAGLEPASLSELVHGTTVATNAILELKGARTGLLTTRGFRDLLEVRRMRVPRLYDPLWEKPRPLVERHLRLEVDERIDQTGAVLTPLDEGSVRDAVGRLLAEGVDAIAVCLLHSYRNPAHERRVGQIVRELAPAAYVSLSSEVWPQIREYERTSTTVVNAYVGPVLASYLAALESRLAAARARPRVLVMQSGGGAMTARMARLRPAYAVESGPAAGVIAAARLARPEGDPPAGALARGRLITLDMGGTTAKASIVEAGAIQYSSETEIGGGVTIGNRLNRGGGYLLSVPAIDICEVGAGGGSIASVDPGGALHVGPRSAGAEPGPACYGRGGVRATLTDANACLGYLPPGGLLGGDLPLDFVAARDALRRDVAEPLGLELEAAAWAVHRIVVASMVRVVRAVSSERGRDPRDFALVSFGGNGPVHGALVAADLGVRSVVVPPHPGLFSAWGLLRADVELGFSSTLLRRADGLAVAELAAAYAALQRRALDDLAEDGYRPEQLAWERYAELRYVGQSFELRVPLPAAALDAGTRGTRRVGRRPGDAEKAPDVSADATPASPLPLREGKGEGVKMGGAVAALVTAFAAEHERSYGHAFPDQPVEIVNIGVVARVATAAPLPYPLPEGEGTRMEHAAPVGSSLNPQPSTPTPPEVRRAYFGPDHGFQEAVVLTRDAIPTEPRRGPAIVEEYDATTVVPPDWTIRRDRDLNLILEPAP